MEKIVRIGGASGFWGDSAIATAQLLTSQIDYLVYDYLAETTLSIMARARAKDTTLGYATDFVSVTMAENLPAIAARGVKVLSNAGGLNPAACRDALQALARARGIDINIALVTGDAFEAPGYVRLSFAASMANLESGFDRIQKFLLG